MHKNLQGFLYPLAYPTNLLISFSSSLSLGYQTHHLHYFLFLYLCLQQLPNILQDTAGKQNKKLSMQILQVRLADQDRSKSDLWRTAPGAAGIYFKQQIPAIGKQFTAYRSSIPKKKKKKSEFCPFSSLMYKNKQPSRLEFMSPLVSIFS